MKEALYVVFMVFLGCTVALVRPDASNHKYKLGEAVPLHAVKVAPYRNPSETYRFFDLPFCSPVEIKDKSASLGELLGGDRVVDAPYKLDFLVDIDARVACKRNLSSKEISKFRKAVKEDYFFQMYYDDLPVWGFLGKVAVVGKSDGRGYKYYLSKLLDFEISYNKDRVINVNVRVDTNALVDLNGDKDVEVEFMYTAKWIETNQPFEKRMERYHRQEIHWPSITNSCATVLLILFLSLILMRVLKNDFAKYTQDVETSEDTEETGWKYIHSDVFRFPPHKSLFAAALGSGMQFLFMVVFIFFLAVVGVFYPYNRGPLLAMLVVISALTSGIAGYTSASFYRQLEGTYWVHNIVLAGGLFSVPLFLTFCFLNTVAIAYRTTAALPLGTIVVLFLIWTLVSFPLLVLGGVMGKNSKIEFEAPCRTSNIPREIPPLSWYRRTVPQMAIAGVLPFAAIYNELYYILRSFWGFSTYTNYGTLFVVFVILLIVTAFVTIGLTYLQLAAEDHRWWLRSFLCGGSTGLFIYGFCLYYYYNRTDMKGFMQLSFFFGYMACVSYAFFLMLGSVGFCAALFFVRKIYGSIKCD